MAVTFPVAPPYKDGQMFISWVADTVAEMGNEPFATWYGQHGKIEHDCSFAQLWKQAGCIAKRLLAEGLKKGDIVVTCCGISIHSFEVFLGCCRAGIVPAFVYPPNPRRLAKSLDIVDRIAKRCNAKALLVDSRINMLRWKPFSPQWPQMKYVVTDSSGWNIFGDTDGDDLPEPDVTLKDPVFLQYTSGSTGDPKGISISNDVLNSNIAQGLQFMVDIGLVDYASSNRRRCSIFSWVPPFHDMGLVIMLACTFVGGHRGHYCSPMTFIANPPLWIRLMSKYKIHMSMAPNFSFALVARKFLAKPTGDLDLSSLYVMISAGEPINQNDVLAFEKAFTPFGLRKEWFVQCYGLAESVCSVTYCKGLVMRSKRGQNASCIGVPEYSYKVGEVSLRIVDPNTLCIVPEGVQGELWVCSNCVTSGYLEKSIEENDAIFRARIKDCGVEDQQRTFLRTGDLGFIDGGRVFICGRIKDMIIYHGENFFPQDMEDIVGRAGAGMVRPGCIAAFSDESSSGELVVVFEIRQEAVEEAAEVCQKVYSAVYRDMALKLDRIIVLRETTIPKTTSGKIRRRQTRLSIHAGELEILYDAVFGKHEHESVDGQEKSLDISYEVLKMQKPKVCVVGAGMAGLISAKTLLESGFDVTVFESRETLGGVWSPDAPYYSVTTPVGDGGYEFLDMVSMGGDCTTRAQNYDCAKKYASENGVLPCCYFGEDILNIAANGNEWDVIVKKGASEELHKFEFVILSTGLCSNPQTPDWSQMPGKAGFVGEIIHSSKLQSDQQLSGKRVLVIGEGRASIDIVCTAFEAGARGIHHAWQTNLMMGYDSNFMDIVDCCRTLTEVIPFNDIECPQFRIDYMQTLLENKYTEWGLPEHMFPGKYLFAKSNVAITRNDYLGLYKSGAFTAECATVASFEGPSSVVLSNGTIVDVDVIILATGDIDRIAKEVEEIDMQKMIGIKPLKPDSDKALRLYRGILPVHNHKNIAFVGYTQGLFDLLLYQTQANWVAGLFSGQFELPGPEHRDSDVDKSLGFMRLFDEDSDGTSVAGWQFQYMKKLLGDMSIPIDFSTAMNHNSLSEFCTIICKQLDDFSLVRSAIVRTQSRLEPQMPYTQEKIREAARHRYLPKFLAEIKSTCQEKGDKVFARWYDERGKELKRFTFSSVWKAARVWAQCMKLEWGLSPGDRVMLIYFPGIQFYPVMLGCFLAGVIPTFIHPPDPNQMNESLGFLMKIVQSVRSSFALVDKSIMGVIRSAWLGGLSPEAFPTVVVADNTCIERWSQKYGSFPYDDVNIDEDGIAFIHSTIDSNYAVHGVMITHAALQSNIDLMFDGLYDCFASRQGYMPEDVRCFNWLPHYSNAGLMHFILPLSKGWQIGAMSEETFRNRPLLWLELMSIHGTQYTFAPDFAYSLCCERLKKEEEEANGASAALLIDLKKLVVAGVGADVVRLSALKLFSKIFMPLGFRRDAFTPSYSKVENVYAITYAKDICISITSKCTTVAVGSRELFGEGLDVKIVDIDDSFEELPDGQEGEVWIKSNSIASGYFWEKEKSLRVFGAELGDLDDDDSYLRTGDLGFFESGSLFISGQLESAIIGGDQIFHPTDIENVAYGAVMSDVEDPMHVLAISKDVSVRPFEQSCIILLEVCRGSEPKADEVASRVWYAVSKECGLSPFQVFVFQKGTLPVGVVSVFRIHLARRMLQTGQLVPIGEATAGKNGYVAISKDSKQLMDDTTTIKWKKKQVERQEQILQVICSEVRRVVPLSGDKLTLDEMGDMSIFDVGFDFIQFEAFRTSVSNIVGLAVPFGPGALLDNLTFRGLSVRIERLRFPDDGSSERNDERGYTAPQSKKVKPANVKFARDHSNLREQYRLQNLMNERPSRYEYCSELPTVPEKRMDLANVLISNVMGFILAIMMILSSLHIAFSPMNWAMFTLRSDVAAIALVPACYVMFIGALLLWLWLIRVCLLPSLLEPGRYPIYGSTHLRCWILEVCLTATRPAFYPFSGTIVNTWLFRAVGAKIGHRVKISSHPVFSSCLLIINDGATCESTTHLQCHMFVSSMLVVAPIYIGSNVSIRDTASVEPGASMMNGSQIDMCSTVPMGWKAPEDTYMVGGPALASSVIDLPALKTTRGLRLSLAPFTPYLLLIPLYIHRLVFKSVLSLISSDEVASWQLQLSLIWIAMFPSVYAATIGGAGLTIITKWCLVWNLRAGPQTRLKALRLEVYEVCAEVLFPVFRHLPQSLVGLFLHLLGATVSQPLIFEENGFVDEARYLNLVKTGNLLKMGSGVFLGNGDYLHKWKDPLTGQLFLYEVKIPDGCFFAGHSYVGVGAQLEGNIGVLGGSCVPPFTKVTKSRICVGSEGRFSLKMPQNIDYNIKMPASRQLHVFLIALSRSAVNLVPVTTFVTLWLQLFQLLMRRLDPSMFIFGAYISLVGAISLNSILMVALHNTIWKLLRLHSTDKEHRINSIVYHSRRYRTWFQSNLILHMLSEFVLVYTGSSPLSTILLRLLGMKNIGKDFIIDSHGVQLCELAYCVVSDNVCVNNHAVLSPHTFSFQHNLDIRNLELGDKTTLLPYSAIFGGTKLPKGAMLGSHCYPLRSQALEPEQEYNDTPCYIYNESHSTTRKPSSSNRLCGDSNNLPLKQFASRVARSALKDVLGEDFFNPKIYDKPVENVELELDSVQMVEYANKVMTKARCKIQVELFLDASTVGEVVDILLRTPGFRLPSPNVSPLLS